MCGGVSTKLQENYFIRKDTRKLFKRDLANTQVLPCVCVCMGGGEGHGGGGGGGGGYLQRYKKIL